MDGKQVPLIGQVKDVQAFLHAYLDKRLKLTILVVISLPVMECCSVEHSVSPNFEKDFIIYCYASEHTLSSILTQKDDKDNEAPIAFMNIPLKKHELNYTQMEKHAFSVVRALKHTIFYIHI